MNVPSVSHANLTVVVAHLTSLIAGALEAKAESLSLSSLIWWKSSSYEREMERTALQSAAQSSAVGAEV